MVFSIGVGGQAMVGWLVWEALRSSMARARSLVGARPERAGERRPDINVCVCVCAVAGEKVERASKRGAVLYSETRLAAAIRFRRLPIGFSKWAEARARAASKAFASALPLAIIRQGNNNGSLSPTESCVCVCVCLYQFLEGLLRREKWKDNCTVE